MQDHNESRCAVLREIGHSAIRVDVLGTPRLSDRVGSTLVTSAPQLQHLVLQLSEPNAAKGADQVLTTIGNRLRALDLLVASHGTLPAVSLEDCTALQELRLVLDMHPLAPLGPLRMRGDEAPPAVAAIAALGPCLRSLELVGSAVPRVLDPPHRLAGLTDLTALTRLKIDMPQGFLAAGAAAEVRDGDGGGSGEVARPGSVLAADAAAAAAVCAAGLRWRAVPVAASLGSLVELHLGRSYELTVYDMAVLAPAPQLALLACRNIVLPPTTPTTTTMGSAREHPPLSCPAVRSRPPAVPLPQRLRELQVRRLPSAPVLAALESLPAPGLQVLKCHLSAAGFPAAVLPLDAALEDQAVAPGGESQTAAVAAAAQQAGELAAVGGGGGTTSAALGGGGSSIVSLQLALVGTSCAAESMVAEPWVAEVALSAFHLIARLLFARALPSPSSPPPGSLSHPAATAVAPPPPLLIRPFERGGGGRRAGRGGSGAAASASTMLRGPYAGSWLSTLSVLSSAGLTSLQLRHFEFEWEDLQLLRVAFPLPKSCEVRECEGGCEEPRRRVRVGCIWIRIGCLVHWRGVGSSIAVAVYSSKGNHFAPPI
ncbi:hypothetical protein VOLCADRAFT_92151 [Volvox carteri f. nagariensis]|uniref:Uncharacterized protein n=1 Tax=Volvox carteri f. nagariensis TaxID=3068 RepID=D8TYR3_VOLCA|nr:uncharacterized protein VOLCADRAFT_92151 [Volvox carteri f. nagariensis]EFJ47437.1 hypothetical protein VOLCADRAFT_92151 [Volvox carteri f. nagariensis]|eukprot:XP_002951626.1 hypothetical protein VOLCADRAFT_92151 [Volvox carteri f. nagariensis]